MAMASVDLLIVGGGPAGLAAANFFSRLGRSCLVYDSGLYRNANSTSAHTIPGFDGINPAHYRASLKKELEIGYDWTKFVDGKIVELQKAEKGFRAVGEKGEEVNARKVIIATGVKDQLSDIPGLQEAWGRRAIHCIFCHGTETRDQPIAHLFPPNNAAMNPMIVGSVFQMWPTLKHPKVFFLTHGSDVGSEEGLKASGLEKFMPIIEKNPEKYQIISSEIINIESKIDGLTITFKDHTPLDIPYMTVFPERIMPSSHGAPLLTQDLLKSNLSPMGAIAGPDPALPLINGPRMGEDPRTQVKGLFWAGNAGSPMANINLSVGQGQTAAAYASHELGVEDLEAGLV